MIDIVAVVIAAFALVISVVAMYYSNQYSNRECQYKVVAHHDMINASTEKVTGAINSSQKELAGAIGGISEKLAFLQGVQSSQKEPLQQMQGAIESVAKTLAENSALRKEVEQLQQTLTEREQGINQLQAQYDDLNKRYAAEQEKNVDLKIRNSELSQRVERLSDENKALCAQQNHPKQQDCKRKHPVQDLDLSM